MLSKPEVYDVICSSCFGYLFLLNFITLWVNSADNKLVLFFSYFFFQLETTCMEYQIHFSEIIVIIIKEKYFNMSSAEIFVQTVKRSLG